MLSATTENGVGPGRSMSKGVCALEHNTLGLNFHHNGNTLYGLLHA